MFVKSLFWFLIFLILCGSCSNLNLAYCFKAKEYISVFSEAEARLAINAADERILVCYMIASDVENSGANVSALLLVLNEAEALSSQAKLAFGNDEFDTAANLATSCVEKLDGFDDDARFLEQETSRQQFLDLVIFAASVVATAVVFVASIVAWLVLNRKSGKLRPDS